MPTVQSGIPGNSGANLLEQSVLLEGMKLKFVWPEQDKQKPIICKLDEIEKIVESNSGRWRILLFLGYSQKCPIFKNKRLSSGNNPSLIFINDIQVPGKFQCGTMVETWDGRRNYFCRLPDGREMSSWSTAGDDEVKRKNGQIVGIWVDHFKRYEIQGKIQRHFLSFETLAN